MKFFYYIENDEKKGPFTLLEKDEVRLSKDTLVWEESFDNWMKAEEVDELREFISKNPPPVPEETKHNKPKVGYGSVEDIAKVDYKYAIILCGAFMFQSIFWKESYFGWFGLIAMFCLPYYSWKYFKKFFDQMGDRDTSKFVKGIMYSYILFFINFFFMSMVFADDLHYKSLIELIINGLFGALGSTTDANYEDTEALMTYLGIATIAIIGSFAFIWYSGIKLLKLDDRYEFSLKHIAIASMICIPLWMISVITYNKYDDDNSLVWNIFLMAPYILLFLHFLKAEKYDATQ